MRRLTTAVQLGELTVVQIRGLTTTELTTLTPAQFVGITAAQLDALAGDRKARKRYRKANPDRLERKRARYVLNAAYDLAHELADARGADTDRVLFARAEVERIRAGIPSPW